MTPKICAIRRWDNSGVASLIRTVMPEFGASGPGFAIHDPEVDDMHGVYSQLRSAYFVVLRGSEVVGGGGVAPLQGGPEDTCELRKMYFLPEVRDLGIGQRMLDLCLQTARELGFKRCYLETLTSMTGAKKLYEKNGFEPLKEAMGKTGHFGCNNWYLKAL